MSAPTWPELQVERLKEYCASPECGTSAWIARQMNDEFGTTYTRNAIIGKMGRCEIAVPRPLSATKEKKIKKARKPTFNFSKPSTTIIDNEPTIMPTVFPSKCSLLELNNETCRFPIGDPLTSEFFFCGQPEADMTNKVPYCRAHTRAAVAKRLLSTG